MFTANACNFQECVRFRLKQARGQLVMCVCDVCVCVCVCVMRVIVITSYAIISSWPCRAVHLLQFDTPPLHPAAPARPHAHAYALLLPRARMSLVLRSGGPKLRLLFVIRLNLFIIIILLERRNKESPNTGAAQTSPLRRRRGAYLISKARRALRRVSRQPFKTRCR